MLVLVRQLRRLSSLTEMLNRLASFESVSPRCAQYACHPRGLGQRSVEESAGFCVGFGLGWVFGRWVEVFVGGFSVGSAVKVEEGEASSGKGVKVRVGGGVGDWTAARAADWSKNASKDVVGV
jgi:hypothetical protein